jgi:hypothetical protein
MKKKLYAISGMVLLSLLVVPIAVSAANKVSDLSGFVTSIYNLLKGIIPILISIALIGFMWGVVLYLFGKSKDDGRTFMLWGIIALFVMTSIWGLVGILRGTLFGTSSDTVPTVNVPSLR